MILDKQHPRPNGYNYKEADDLHLCCKNCNPHGFNRTGLRPTEYDGASATCRYAVRCEYRCFNGIDKRFKHILEAVHGNDYTKN